MILWRLSAHTDLAGRGGMRAPGRWHSIGQPILYLAEQPACCLLEALAHDLRLETLPAGLKWMEVSVDPQAAIDRLESLPDGWTTDAAITRGIGDAWLRSRSAALLRVPSHRAPATSIYLHNPRHPDAARLTIVRVMAHPPDLSVTPAATATAAAPARRGRSAKRAPAPPA